MKYPEYRGNCARVIAITENGNRCRAMFYWNGGVPTFASYGSDITKSVVAWEYNYPTRLYELPSGDCIFVSIIRSGQPRPYADSEYEYRLERLDGISDEEIKQFCTTRLHPKKYSREEAKENGYFLAGYYKFIIDPDCYIYKVCEPYCD